MAWKSSMDFQENQSQKEGWEDQGEVNELGGAALAVVTSPGPPSLLSSPQIIIVPGGGEGVMFPGTSPGQKRDGFQAKWPLNSPRMFLGRGRTTYSLIVPGPPPPLSQPG